MNNKLKQVRLNLFGEHAQKIIWLLIGAYVIFFSFASFLKYKSFSYYDFDLAVHAQVLWNILHGSIRSSILGIDFLGNHMHLILFFIAPLYRVFPHPLTLLFLQSISLGFAAYPLYLLAKSILDKKWALIVAFLYLFYPALGYINLYEFHPTVFATLFLMFMFYYFQTNKFGKFILFIILSLSCQENISLVIIMVGIYAFINRKGAKWIVLPIILGFIYLFLSLILISYFNKDTIQFISLYSHLGNSLPEIITTILFHPLKVLKIILVRHKLIYLLQLFAPLSFLPLLSPLTLSIALPLFLQHLLSSRYTEVTIYYHYVAEMLPFIFVSLIFGIDRLLKNAQIKKNQWVRMLFLAVVLIGSNIYLGPHFRLLNHFVTEFRRDDLDIQKEAFLKRIPKDAAVVSTFEFLPRLTQRKELYSFHHLYTGFYTLSRRPYKIPDTVEYALIDFNDILTFAFNSFYSPDRYKNIIKFLSEGNFGVVKARDTIVLFERNRENKYPLYYLISDRPVLENETAAVVDGSIELLGYKLKEINNDHFLHITFYWLCLNRTEKDINVFFDFINEKGIVARRLLRPICYRILPTNSWRSGQYIVEERFLIIPSNLPKGLYRLKAGFFDYSERKVCKVTSKLKYIDPFTRLYLGEITK